MNVAPVRPQRNEEECVAPRPVLVSEETGADVCAVSRRQFRKWVDEGLIRPVDLPIRRNLYAVSDLESFVANLPRRA